MCVYIRTRVHIHMNVCLHAWDCSYDAGNSETDQGHLNPPLIIGTPVFPDPLARHAEQNRRIYKATKPFQCVVEARMFGILHPAATTCPVDAENKL